MSSAEIWRLVITASITSVIVMVISTLLGGYLALCWFERKKNQIANKVKKASDTQDILLHAIDKLRKYTYCSWLIRGHAINKDQSFWKEFKKTALISYNHKNLVGLLLRVENIYEYFHIGTVIYGDGEDAENRVKEIKRYTWSPMNQEHDENVFSYVWEFSDPGYEEKDDLLLKNINKLESEIRKIKL